MAFSYRQRECETCGGQLRLDERTNLYECIYCGNTYEREQQYDGQFSVRYAAKQALATLLDAALADDGTITNWQLVQNNLNDCQKIDPSYAGTTVAQLAASIQRVRLLMGNREAVRTDLAQAQAAYQRLGSPFDPAIQEEEADFYDKLDSADITAMLISVFGTFGDDARVRYLQDGFSAADINSSSAALDALGRAFSLGDWAQVDALVDSSAPIDAMMLFERLLREYPDTERKVGNVASAVMRGAGGQRACDALSDYLKHTDDSVDTRFGIAQGARDRGIVPDGEAIAALIDASGGDARAASLLAGAQNAGSLGDEDVAVIVRALLTRSPGRVAAQGLNALADAGHYLVFPQDAMLAMLTRTDLAPDDRKSLLATAARAGMTQRRRQAILADYLRAQVAAKEKITTISLLADGLNGINPMTVEDYLLHGSVDGAAKPEVLQALLAHVTARETIRMSAQRYCSAAPDSMQVGTAVMRVLSAAGMA